MELGTGFKQNAGGIFDFGDSNNWLSEVIDGTFRHSPVNAQEITFASDRIVSQLTFDLGTPGAVLTLRSDGAADRVLTLDGNVAVSGTNGSTIVIGSNDSNKRLSLVMSGGRTFSVDAGNSLTIANTLSGVGHALAKQGGGTLIVTGAAEHTGGTSVAAGTLMVGDGGSSGSLLGNVDVSVGATVRFNRNDTNIVANAFSGGGALLFEGGGTFELTGSSSLSGKTTVAEQTVVNANVANVLSSAGAVRIFATDATHFGTLNVNESQETAGLISDDAGEQFTQVNIADGKVLTLAVPDDTSVAFKGTISGGANSKLVKTGLGVQQIGGVATYGGGTEIKAGQLRAIAANVLPASGEIIVGDGEGNDSATLSVYESQEIGALSGASDGTVALEAGKKLKTSTGASTVFAGTILGGGELEKAGTGTLALSGANSFTGRTTISGGVISIAADDGLGAAPASVVTGHLKLDGGTLETTASFSLDSNRGISIQGNGTIDTAAGTTLTYGGIIAGDTLTKTGAGALTLTGANTYVGANGAGTVVNEGTFVLGNTAGNTLAAGADVTLNNSGVLNVANDQTIRALMSSSATSSVVITSGKTLTANLPSSGAGSSGTFNGVISGDGAFAKAGPGLLELGGDNLFLGATTVSGGTLYLGTGDGGSLAGAVTGDIVLSGGTLGFNRSNAALSPYVYAGEISGSGTVAFFGTGYVKLTGNSFYSGATTVEKGTLVIGAAGALPSATAVTVNVNGSLRVEENQTIGGLAGVGGTHILSGKKLTVSSGQLLSYQGAISGDGAFEKAGVGTMTFNGPSSYFGDTWITGGTLQDGASAFSSNSTMRVNTGATLQVNFNETIAGLSDYAANTSGTVMVGNGAWLTIANANTNTFSGAFNGAGMFSKSGTGELVFAGTSNYSGVVNVNAGKLTVGAANAFTAGAISVDGSGTFNVAGSTAISSLGGTGTVTVGAGQVLTIKNSQVLDTVVSGDGGVTFANGNQANGLTTITADQTYGNPTTITSGTLQLGDGSAATGSVAGNIVTSNGTKVVFEHGSNSRSYSGSISGGGALVKNGAGTLTLSGANSYGGSTTINSGTLKVSGQANVLPAATQLSVAAGATFDVGANQEIGGFGGSFATSSIVIEAAQILEVHLGSSYDFKGVISDAGQLHVTSNGSSDWVLTLKNENTYTGGTEIGVSSVLQLAGDGAAGNRGMIGGNIVNDGMLSFARSDDVIFGGTISGSGQLRVMSGSGEVRLTAANGNSYSGGTSVYGGKLIVLNGANSATGTGSVDVYVNGLLGGNGRVSGALNLHTGGSVAPAISLGQPATLKVGATTFGTDGEFVFQIRDADGVTGTDMSLLEISNALTINATSGSPFVIELYTLNGTSHGTMANFNSEQAYSWTFATVTGAGTINGFGSAKFHVDPTNFQNTFTGSFSVGLDNLGTSLLVNYTPAAVPEPATWLLLGLGSAIVMLAARRAKRR